MTAGSDAQGVLHTPSQQESLQSAGAQGNQRMMARALRTHLRTPLPRCVRLAEVVMAGCTVDAIQCLERVFLIQLQAMGCGFMRLLEQGKVRSHAAIGSGGGRGLAHAATPRARSGSGSCKDHAGRAQNAVDLLLERSRHSAASGMGLVHPKQRQSYGCDASSSTRHPALAYSIDSIGNAPTLAASRQL